MSDKPLTKKQMKFFEEMMQLALLEVNISDLIFKKGLNRKQIVNEVKKSAFLKILECNALLEDEEKDD